MACYVPFNDRNLDISLFVLRPTVVCIDDLVEALKQVSLYTETLGCVHTSIFKSIHGSLILWYGAWIKRSDEKKQLLNATLLSMMTNVASMAILIEHNFFNAYSGESRDGSPAAKFFTGDIISVGSATLTADEPNVDSVSYACLAVFKDRFRKMAGADSGVCLKSQSSLSIILCLFVWKSLQCCYSYVLNSDYRRAILPYIDGSSSVDVKYDVFRVVYVSGHNVLDDVHFNMPKNRMLENEVAKYNEASSLSSSCARSRSFQAIIDIDPSI